MMVFKIFICLNFTGLLPSACRLEQTFPLLVCDVGFYLLGVLNQFHFLLFDAISKVLNHLFWFVPFTCFCNDRM